MKPIDLYNRTPEYKERVVDEDGYFSTILEEHIPEIQGFDIWRKNAFDQTYRVCVEVYKHFDFDHRRYWRLASVVLDGKNIMIIRNAGREGRDHSSRIITDIEGYRELVKLLFSMYNPELNNVKVVDEHEDVPELTEFYGNSLDGYFERYYY
jgi:hypothetical protein